MSIETKNPEVVRGVPAIAKVLCESNERRVYYILEKGYVPGAYKEGAIWCLSVPRYRRVIHGEAA